ncbi:hypothetical protein QWZ08_07270 [Ferruginibacter paludis]|uniref:hypothetical protein n=1 Tax=Ferruginibacter paludis TaxID=1310417 RepID=UPI0025B5476F|nr:hypothetical protein [Ferruginibacter paludis]MDN3655418.1 hypothetical protein [Ferruginibacter paludis]
MKRNTILAISAMVVLAACSNGGTSDTNTTTDTMPTGKMDTMQTQPTGPTSGNGNTAAGTSNPAPNLTDTAAIGTNRSAGRDTSHVPKDTPHRMKH